MRSIVIARTLLSAIVVVACSTIGCIIGPQTSSTGDGNGGDGGAATSSTAKTSSTGGSSCDGQANCADCQQCARMTVCYQQAAACNGNSACIGLDQCLALCGATPDCAQQCVAQNQVGVEDYNALIVCLDCQECPTKCAGQANCH